MIQVKVINRSENPLPHYATLASAGMDLRANNDEPIELAPLQRAMIPTGLYMELPVGYEAQIRPRSGLAIKHGLSIPNSPGTIDADYRGEIKVLLINLGQEPFVIQKGERIAQMIVAKFEQVSWEPVAALGKTERGEGGFGHTGK